MKIFWQWCEALSPQQFTMMRNLGYQYIDEISVSNLELYLLYGASFPKEFRWHLAFQRSGMNVFDINQQFSRETDKKERQKTSMVDSFQAMEPMLHKIHEWAKKHKQLVIASTNEELTEKWLANISLAARYFDIPINITTHNYLGATIHLVKASNKL